MTGALAKAVAAADLAFTAPARARALAGAALAEADGHAEAAAVAEHALGLAGVATGRLADAETRLRAAVRLADGAGLRERAAQTRGVLGYVLTLTGRTAEALRELDRAMPELTGTAAARLRMQRAVVLTEISRFGDAAAEFAAALETLRAAGGDALIEATVRTNRSIVLARLGDWRGAEEDLRRAERGFAATGHVGRTAMVWQNRGLAATVRGDVPAALTAYDEAASRYEEAGTDQGLLPIERAETLLSVRLIAEAREAATAAVADYERRRNAVDLVQARLLLAKVALLDGDPETAVREATLARRSAARQHRPGWAALGGYLALRARRDSGLRTTAMLRSGQHTVAALTDAGWVVPALDARLIVASLALELGRPAVAEAELTIVGRAGRGGPAELRARAWHATALLRLVHGDRRGADAAVRAGVRVIGRFRAGLGASELRAHASGHASELTGLGLRLAVEAGHPEAVLRWAEQRHAGALRLRPARPPDDEGLAADLAALRQTALDLAAGTGQAPALLRRQARLEKAVRDRARHASGALDSNTVSTSDTRIPSRPELAAALGPATLVEYVELDGRLTALVLGGGRLRRCELGSAVEAAERLDELRFALRRQAFGFGSFAGLAERTARRLDDLLLAPLPLGEGPLVIVPTGRLHELPWPALPGARGRPVSLAPSAALWHRAATAPRGEGGDHVVVAGPGLPHAAAEAAALARRYPGARRFTGRTARVEPVLAALDGAALGHLAAHGTFRTDNPLFSSLRLADGPLTVYDLERLAHPPRQVVLSGCDSGRSAIHAGDELLGLASALLALGTTSLVATVLPIPDDAGRALMVRHHRHLASGLTPAAALARAQSDLPDSPAAASYVCYGAG
ncbi:CHAT domain-containing protein [Amycolatopsis mediterranei]|uniref:CHAT domain-containing protein n=1 Tax=Amycolatopsis mediterranei TaxID=33910 RepID=UPI0034203D01